MALPIVAAAAGENHDIVQELQDRLERGRDVGQGGGVEDVVDRPHIVLVDDALANQQHLGPRAGVKLNRQIYELKHHDGAEGDNAEQDQACLLYTSPSPRDS